VDFQGAFHTQFPQQMADYINNGTLAILFTLVVCQQLP
jgi:hypothetical protein